LKPKPNGPIYPNTIANLSNQLTNGSKWKSTFKEEFVTAGGINLKEINFKTIKQAT
jgi:predicted flavoprotein YhiN